MVYVLTAILIAYCFLVIVLIMGWQKAMRMGMQPSGIDGEHQISVIIPFRNEERNILSLLEDLCKQNHPVSEVILIDDHSGDRSCDVIKEFVESHTGSTRAWRLEKNSGEGKKMGITTGIRIAKGSVIATLDADCRIGPGWMKSIDAQFGKEEVKLLIGPVCLQPEGSFFAQIQSMEFASLIGSGAATAAWASPIMCNGANLAFRKTAFEKVNGYDGNLHIPSGDDEFLMRKISDRYPGSVCFNGNPNSIVNTKPAETILEFTQQRIRWAGKWKHNASITARLMALWIFVVQICILLSLVLWSTPLLFGLLLRTLVEFIFLRKILLFLRVPWSWRSFILLQIIYPIYVITIAFASLIFSFQWKGRRH